jgi:hypothetical protein
MFAGVTPRIVFVTVAVFITKTVPFWFLRRGDHVFLRRDMVRNAYELRGFIVEGKTSEHVTMRSPRGESVVVHKSWLVY